MKIFSNTLKLCAGAVAGATLQYSFPAVYSTPELAIAGVGAVGMFGAGEFLERKAENGGGQ